MGAVADDQACPGVYGPAREVFEEFGRLVAVVARLMAVDRQHDDFGRCASATDLRQDRLDVASIRNEIHRGLGTLLDVRAEQGELFAAGFVAALQRRRRTPQRLVGLRVDGDVGDISERVYPGPPVDDPAGRGRHRLGRRGDCHGQDGDLARAVADDDRGSRLVEVASAAGRNETRPRSESRWSPSSRPGRSRSRGCSPGRPDRIRAT